MPETAAHHSSPKPAPRRWPGRLLALIAVALLAGGAWWLVQHRQPPPAASMGRSAFFRGGGGGGGPAASVSVARAEPGRLPVVVEALGTVVPVNEVELKPQVSGILTEVLFTEGQMVEKGQLLARIDARPFEQQLAQARGVRAQNKAQLAQARLTLQRYQTLWKQDSIARQEVDAQTALVRQLEGTLQSNRGAEEAARINLDFTHIRAPLDGRIGLRGVDAGNMVSAGGSPGIATITQMKPMDLRFAVPQDRVRAVLEAQRQGPLQVTALDSSRTGVLATGEFLTLDNTMDAATGTLQAKARFDNEDEALFPNQFVNVRLWLGQSEGVLVPVTAVRSGPDGDYVYVVDDQQLAYLRIVEQDGADGESVLIRSGLDVGETVVTEGGDRVRDGGSVRILGDEEEQAENGAPAADAPQRRGNRPAGPRP